MDTLPNDLSLLADQSWAKMMMNTENRVTQSAQSLHLIVDAVKNVNRLAKELVDKSRQTDDFDLLKTQEFELPEEP